MLENLWLATASATGGAVLGLIMMWALDTREAPLRMLMDPALEPKRPGYRGASKLGATRTLLQSFVNDILWRDGQAGLEEECPVHVTGRHVPRWTSNTLALEHDVEPWTTRYEGGATATAVSPDGVRLRLDATIPRRRLQPGTGTMLAAVRTADGAMHVLHAPSRTVMATTRVTTSGIGRFQRHRAAPTPFCPGQTIRKRFDTIGSC